MQRINDCTMSSPIWKIYNTTATTKAQGTLQEKKNVELLQEPEN